MPVRKQEPGVRIPECRSWQAACILGCDMTSPTRGEPAPGDWNASSSYVRSSQVHPLHVQPVTTGAQLEALRSEWQELWLRDPKATPFQSPSWLIPWWHHLGQGELLSLALRDHGEKLVGFL